MVDFAGRIPMPSETFQGSEEICRVPQGFRLISLIETVSPLAPTGVLLVVCPAGRQSTSQGQEATESPVQILELLAGVASDFSRQVKQSKRVLAKLGHCN